MFAMTTTKDAELGIHIPFATSDVIVQSEGLGHTASAKAFYEANKGRIGTAQEVTGHLVGRDKWVAVTGTKATVCLSGLGWGYHGEGARGLYDLLSDLGVTHVEADRVCFEHSDPVQDEVKGLAKPGIEVWEVETRVKRTARERREGDLNAEYQASCAISFDCTSTVVGRCRERMVRLVLLVTKPGTHRLYLVRDTGGNGSVRKVGRNWAAEEGITVRQAVRSFKGIPTYWSRHLLAVADRKPVVKKSKRG